jgi:hypothetical protein
MAKRYSHGMTSNRRGGPGYPFAPKSNLHLEPGQFWAVPLTDGWFACGRVLDIKRRDDGDRDARYLNNRAFLAGLLDWTGDEPPTADSIAGAKLVDQGQAHVRTFQRTGGVFWATARWRPTASAPFDGWARTGRPATSTRAMPGCGRRPPRSANRCVR